MTRVVLKGSAPVLVSYPRLDMGGEALVRATSVTVRVAAAGVPWPDAGSNAAADTFDQTVTAVAAEGARAILCTPTGLVAGRRYLVVDADGVFAVTCLAVLADGMRTGEPLRRAVSATAKVQGWAVLYTLPTTDTANVGEAQALFSATVGGVAATWVEPFRVAARLPVIPLSATELVQTYPDIKSLLARQDETAEQVIRSAWDHLVLPRVLRSGAYPEDILHPSVLTPALAMACMLHVARQSRQVETEYVTRWQKEFDLEIERAKGRVDWHEAPQDADPPLTPDPLTKRNVTRLVR